MEDKRRRKITKKELWEKLHNERRMWMMKLEHDKTQAITQTTITIRQVTDLILSGVVRAYGIQEGDEWHLDIETPKNREGFIWSAAVEEVDDHTIRIKVREDDLSQREQAPEETEEPKEEENIEEEEQ